MAFRGSPGCTPCRRGGTARARHWARGSAVARASDGGQRAGRARSLVSPSHRARMRHPRPPSRSHHRRRRPHARAGARTFEGWAAPPRTPSASAAAAAIAAVRAGAIWWPRAASGRVGLARVPPALRWVPRPPGRRSCDRALAASFFRPSAARRGALTTVPRAAPAEDAPAACISSGFTAMIGIVERARHHRSTMDHQIAQSYVWSINININVKGDVTLTFRACAFG